ncbi:MAG: prepilin-type N-terminal cleavage/methylation domain-containing protein [Candidatus Saccharimonadales bacterium]|jgi:hypothetical protein
MRSTPSQSNAAGFTIVELLIATVVFTGILMLVTAGVTHFSNEYYRASYANTVQSQVRSISDDITQSLQFGAAGLTYTPDGPVPDITASCVGSKMYIFRRGVAFDGSTRYEAPGLYRQSWDGKPESCTAPSNASWVPTAGTQLLQKNMRLTQFSISGSDGTGYDVKIRIAYGDIDLLCAAGQPGCATDEPAPFTTDAAVAAAGNAVQCRSGTGSQFCAVSNIDATVTGRN